VSIAAAGDFPTLNQNTTGSAAKWTTARNIAGNSVDGSANATFANKFLVQGTTDAGLTGAQFLGALSTGILKNTTSTGVVSIAAAGDFPTLNQNTTGSAAKLTTTRAIYGNNFDGSAALTQVIASTYGGTGNGFLKVSGPASSEKTMTVPNANFTVARTDAAQTFTGTQTFSTITSTSVANLPASTYITQLPEQYVPDTLLVWHDGRIYFTTVANLKTVIDSTTGSVPFTKGDYYVATTGSDSNPGTYDEPFLTIQHAVGLLSAGDTLYVRGGTYAPTSTSGNGSYSAVYISSLTGTALNPICIFAYPGEEPIISGTNMTGTGQRNGIQVAYCSYVHLRGITVRGVHEYTTSSPNNPAEGWYGESNEHITMEQCVSTQNGNGFRFDNDCDYIYYTNCDSYDNWDYFGWYSSGGAGGYADGFRCNIAAAMHQYFSGCRAWSNSDDGWDHMAGGGYTEITNCWAFSNGASISGTSGDGDGFKLGFTTRGTESGFQRSVYNCVSAFNGAIAFDESMDEGTAMLMRLYNCTAYSNTNDAGFRFAQPDGTSATTLRNNLAYLNGPTDNRNYEGRARNTEDHNTWDGGVTVTNADFSSIDVSELAAARKTDGSLPDVTFLHLVTGSDLIDKGVDVGISYLGTAPDLGAFEKQ
jgi:hypothetical protein